MLFLLLSALIARPDTLRGRVIDDAGQAVAQAIVEVADLGRSVTTGADGAFRIALAPGRYTLAVRRHGFAPVVREISVGAAQPALEIVREALLGLRLNEAPATKVHGPRSRLRGSALPTRRTKSPPALRTARR